MIWVSDHKGNVTYICQEWQTFTGQEPGDALGSGWANVVHPDDRNLAEDGLQEACRRQVEFMVRYRLRRSDGSYVWALGAASPSFTPLTRDFIGFLGLVSRFDGDVQDLVAKAELGAFEPGKAITDFGPVSKLDMVADHLIMAKAIATGYADEVVAAIDLAIHVAGQALVAKQQRQAPSSKLN